MEIKTSLAICDKKYINICGGSVIKKFKIFNWKSNERHHYSLIKKRRNQLTLAPLFIIANGSPCSFALITSSIRGDDGLLSLSE